VAGSFGFRTLQLGIFQEEPFSIKQTGVDHLNRSTGKKDRLGISILLYAKQSEKRLYEQLAAGENKEVLLSKHLERLRWLQHERLVHLIVTLLSMILLLFAFSLVTFVKFSIPTLMLLMISAIMASAYFIHYFKLENLTQHWYLVTDEIWAFEGKQKTNEIQFAFSEETLDQSGEKD
jgi:hypothetical protein